MNVKIDSDIIESILKAYARRAKDQNRVYGLIMGTMENDAYHVKNCIHGYIYESKEETSSGNEGKVFNRLNNETINSLLTNYNNNFPDEMILGGFATDNDIFVELYNLHSTINVINSRTLVNKNKLVLLVDPYNIQQGLSYGLKVYEWKNDEELNLMAFKQFPYSLVDNRIKFASMHSNLVDSTEIMLHLNKVEGDQFNFGELVENIKKRIDEDIKVDNKTRPSDVLNVKYLKKEILLAERYLNVIEKFLESDSNISDDILHKIDYIIHNVNDFVQNEEMIQMVRKEFRHNQVIDSMTNLLNLQIKITEKINNFNI